MTDVVFQFVEQLSHKERLIIMEEHGTLEIRGYHEDGDLTKTLARQLRKDHLSVLSLWDVMQMIRDAVYRYYALRYIDEIVYPQLDQLDAIEAKDKADAKKIVDEKAKETKGYPSKVVVTEHHNLAHYWYHDQVGNVFTVLGVENDRYWVVASDGYSNFILKKDCWPVPPTQ